MKNSFYTVKDVKNALRVGKSFVSFQWIDGRGAINECYGDCQKIMNYCVDMFAGLLVRTEIQTSPEDFAEEIKQAILKRYYENKKDFENENNNG